LKVQFDPRPFCGAGQDNDCDFSHSKILLIAKPSICRQQQLNSCSFRRIEQAAVVEPLPPLPLSGDNIVAAERADEAFRCSMIKEDRH